MSASKLRQKLGEELDDVDRALLHLAAKSLRDVHDENASKDTRNVLGTLADEIDEIAIVKGE